MLFLALSSAIFELDLELFVILFVEMVKQVTSDNNKVRKKQVLVPFERSKHLLIIDPNDFFYSDEINDDDNNFGINKLIFTDLLNATDLSEQVRCIQSSKGNIKSKLLSSSSASNTYYCNLNY